MKSAGLGTGMAGGIKVLWDQVLLIGGTSANSGWVRSVEPEALNLTDLQT